MLSQALIEGRDMEQEDVAKSVSRRPHRGKVPVLVGQDHGAEDMQESRMLGHVPGTQRKARPAHKPFFPDEVSRRDID